MPFYNNDADPSAAQEKIIATITITITITIPITIRKQKKWWGETEKVPNVRF